MAIMHPWYSNTYIGISISCFKIFQLFFHANRPCALMLFPTSQHREPLAIIEKATFSEISDSSLYSWLLILRIIKIRAILCDTFIDTIIIKINTVMIEAIVYRIHQNTYLIKKGTMTKFGSESSTSITLVFSLLIVNSAASNKSNKTADI